MAHQLFSNAKIVKLATPQTTGTTDVVGTALDLAGWTGVLFFTALPTANAGNFLKVQDSDDNSTYNDVAGSKVVAGSNADIIAIDFNTPAKRWVKPVVVRAGVTTTTAEVFAILYSNRVAPQTSGAGIVSKILVGAADGTP